MGAFRDLQSVQPQMLMDGYLARVVHGRELTLAVVEIQPGAELPEHRHANEQFGLVIEGSVIFRIGEETRELAAGGIWEIPSSEPHSVTGGEDGAVVLDVFAPPREEWKALERLEAGAARWPQAPH